MGPLRGRGPRKKANSRETAFRDLFDANHRAVLAYAMRRTATAQDAADLLSDTMLVAWRRIDDVPVGEEGRLWLYGVARNVLANQRRSERRRTRLTERLASNIESVVDDTSQYTADRLWLLSALANMSDDDREVLTLTLWEGLTPAEIAEVLDLPSGTVRARLHRARARVRSQLEASTVERKLMAGHERGDGCPPIRDTEEAK